MMQAGSCVCSLAECGAVPAALPVPAHPALLPSHLPVLYFSPICPTAAARKLLATAVATSNADARNGGTAISNSNAQATGNGVALANSNAQANGRGAVAVSDANAQ